MEFFEGQAVEYGRQRGIVVRVNPSEVIMRIDDAGATISVPKSEVKPVNLNTKKAKKKFVKKFSETMRETAEPFMNPSKIRKVRPDNEKNKS
jgi:hypothetical protein